MSAIWLGDLPSAMAQEGTVTRRTRTTRTVRTTRRVVSPSTTTRTRVYARPLTTTYHSRPAPVYYHNNGYDVEVHDPYYEGRYRYVEEPVFHASQTVYVTPNYRYYRSRPVVYRYVRKPRYVWSRWSESDSGPVYRYGDEQYSVQEAVDNEELDCPGNTFTKRRPYQTWCATDRGTKHGPAIAYYPNGQVRSEGTYKYGTRDGLWIEYYKSGGIRVEGSYRNGEKSGSWTHYDQKSGEETTTVYYD